MKVSYRLAQQPGSHVVLKYVCPVVKVNADILNRSGTLGAIAEGATADILIVAGDPLENLGRLEEQGRHLAVIMQDGRFVKNHLA